MFGRSEPAFVFILRFYNIPATARTTRSLYTALDYYQFNRQSTSPEFSCYYSLQHPYLPW